MQTSTIRFGDHDLDPGTILHMSPAVGGLNPLGFHIWIYTAKTVLQEFFPGSDSTAVLLRVAELQRVIGTAAGAREPFKGYLLTSGGLTVPIYAIADIGDVTEPAGYPIIPVVLANGHEFPFPFPAVQGIKILSADDVQAKIQATLAAMRAEMAAYWGPSARKN